MSTGERSRERIRTDADPADLRRRRRCRRTPRGPCPPHAGADLAHGRRRVRRPGLLQVRELPAHGRLQVPRRLQRAVALRPAPARGRRRRVLVRQPCAGDRAVGAPARHAGDDRDAARRARLEDRGDARLRRRRRDLRPLPRGPRGDRAAPRRGARHDLDPALRPRRRDRRPGHRGQGAVRRDRSARRALRLPRRRRPAERLGAGDAGAVAGLQGLRRRARGRQRCAAVVPHRQDRPHRHAADDRRRRADAVSSAT